MPRLLFTFVTAALAVGVVASDKPMCEGSVRNFSLVSRTNETYPRY